MLAACRWAGARHRDSLLEGSMGELARCRCRHCGCSRSLCYWRSRSGRRRRRRGGSGRSSSSGILSLCTLATVFLRGRPSGACVSLGWFVVVVGDRRARRSVLDGDRFAG